MPARLGSVALSTTLSLATLLLFAHGPAAADPTHGGHAGHTASAATHRAVLTTFPTIPALGAATNLRVRVLGKSDVHVKKFQLLHEQPMHLIAVSQDLEDFAHVHPTLLASGDLATALTFRRAQPYTIFMEYAPTGGSQQLSTNIVRPVGATAKPAKLDPKSSFDGTTSKALSVSGTKVTLVGEPGKALRRGVATRLLVRARDGAGGPAKIVDWLGMPGHAIVLSEDLQTFLHLHGTRSGASSGIVGSMGGHAGHGSSGATPTTGPASDDLSFEVTFPRAGLYKIFVQFKRGTQIVTTPVVVRVGA